MKRSYSVIIKIAVIFTLSLIIYFSLTDYLQKNQLYEWYSYELTVIRAILLMLLNVYFLALAIIIKISVFKKIYLLLLIFGIFAWNISHFNSVLDLNLLSNTSDDFLELMLFVPVIKPRKRKPRLPRSFRLDPELFKKIEEIAEETGESKTYVLESLLEHGIEAYEKEKRAKKRFK